MDKIIKFGETVEGYNTPVLNEREIRAAAGIIFLMIYYCFKIFMSSINITLYIV